jgi:hypothetical protein
MTDLAKLQDAFLKADALAQQGDQQAMQDARMFAQEIKRIQSSGTTAPAQRSGNGIMGQVNAGIAETVGGFVDFVNPFSREVWEQYGLQTGSAVEGLRGGMEAIGADVATEAPDSISGSVARGAGQAAGALLPVTGAARVVQGAGGLVGGLAAQIRQALATRAGVGAEVAAGGVSGGARQVTKDAGGGELAQDLAGIVAPMSIPLAASAAGAAYRGARRLPVSGAVLRGGEAIARGLTPMTREGAASVAGERLQSLSGGADRAEQIARGISDRDPLGRTPAQQTGDPNLLGLERAAANENPVLRERLAARQAGTRRAAQQEIAGMGGDVTDAKTFFEGRLRDFKTSMKARVDQALQMADETVQGVGPRASETTNSLQMTDRVRAALDENLAEEATLWRNVPIDALVPTDQTRTTAKALMEELPRAQMADYPAIARQLLLDEGGLSADETVRELHGLYSELRRVSRSAMAGNDQNKNRARIANDIAESILKDLGAIGGETPAGRAINEARMFSRALHETFDQGAVGRILKRTIDGDTTMTPETALSRTVGRGGAAAVADARDIQTASPQAADEVTDYVRGRFLDSIMTPSGEFSPRSAAMWMRQNRELMNQYPELGREFTRALSSRSAAEALAERSASRVKLAEANSPVARFTLGQDQKAVLSILGADDPVSAARSVAAAARKDTSGQALAGVKAAFSDHLIGKAGTDEGLSGERLTNLLKDGKILQAMRQVYDSGELARIQRIASDLAKVDGQARDVGEFLNSPANSIVEYVVRVTAARLGGQAGGGTMGGSLQTANIAAKRATDMLRNLTNDRARQLLLDAIEDPELFRALLTSTRNVNRPEIRSRLAPYLIGATAATASGE